MFTLFHRHLELSTTFWVGKFLVVYFNGGVCFDSQPTFIGIHNISAFTRQSCVPKKNGKNGRRRKKRVSGGRSEFKNMVVGGGFQK